MAPIIAIVGRPNVGKSSLFNRLSRSRDALVDDMPGITRDRLYSTVQYDGSTFTLIDTGGFDDTDQDPLVKKMREQVETAIDEADAIIFMVDGRQGIIPGDEEVADILRRSRKKVFLAANKIDGPEHDHMSLAFYGLGVEKVYPVSAAHGYGISDLFEGIMRDLPPAELEHEDEDKIRVAVLGKPNVGKSSLINKILGLDRLVVSDIPGTTRDSVDTNFSYRNRDYVLIDTAGLRRKSRVREKIDKFSMIKTLKSIERCHIAVLLIDANEGVSDQDARIFGYAFERDRAIVLAINKWDLVKGNPEKIDYLKRDIDRKLRFISFAPSINLSALTGHRVMKLFDRIDMVHTQFSKKIGTGALNRGIKEIIERHQPPRIKGKSLKFLYATQSRIKPPTFVIFVNRPEIIHFSYERFLVNNLRSHFGLEFSPIKIRFKKR